MKDKTQILAPSSAHKFSPVKPQMNTFWITYWMHRDEILIVDSSQNAHVSLAVRLENMAEIETTVKRSQQEWIRSCLKTYFEGL